MKLLTKFLIGLIGLFGIIGFLPVKAADEVTSGLQISPVMFEEDVADGESFISQFNLKNYYDVPISYTIETELFSFVDDEGAPSYQPASEDPAVSDLTDWIKFADPTSGILQAGEAKNVRFSIDVPVGAEPGGHYGAIFAKTSNLTTAGKSEVAINSRVGCILLITTPGEMEKSAEITEFNPPRFIWSGPTDLRVLVKNTGTVHFKSAVNVEIQPLLGSKSTISMGEHTVIPNNERAFEAKWGKKFPFGFYKLSAIAEDGNGNLISETVTVWALPLIILIPALILIILLFWMISYLKKHIVFVDKGKKSDGNAPAESAPDPPAPSEENSDTSDNNQQ